ncbi:hypothetical protein HFO56_00650 [Rhizobium laguerreae]|uniref:LPD1 domain-containing protein n=1 Tax=Rhizobium laguerreae TaxID=1076926 RepID=UPI001C91B4FA|nr:LPD1 domain-containing protein [Rhizobium laguerreae]MBY3150938.1 hypothetical protein [Rhizobium laguerreae]
MEEERKRRIDDTGEKIGGARKDWARERMVKDDVDDMTDAERVEQVQKDNVWPKPDYAALVEAGMSREAAAQIKVIRDRIAKAPAVSRRRPHSTTLLWYYETLSAVGRHLEACKTLEEVQGVHRILEESIARRSDRQYYGTEGAGRFDVIRKGRTNPVYCPWDDEKKIAALLNQGFPDDVPAWRRGHVVKKYGGRADFVVVKGRMIVGSGFASEDDALSWLKDNWERARTTKKATPLKVPERPHLENIERVGLPDRRDGEDVSPQTFIDVFGFRGVEFGDWLPDDERQLVLNHGYDALIDLADAIGFTPGQLSLGGKLAIAFGARGLGGAHSAHYEPGRRVVNLTRLSGAGALAHEWGHALDHMLGDGSGAPLEIPSLTGWRTRVNDCRTVLAHRGEALANAAQAVLRSLYYRPKTRDEALAEAEKNVAAFQRNVDTYASLIDAHRTKAEAAGTKTDAAYMKKLAKGKAGQEKGREQWEGVRDYALSRSEFHDFGNVTNSFYTEAAKISGSDGYWARPNELFARAFESVVMETLKETSSSSNYLVAWADARFYPEELYKGNPYPSGDDLARLRANFDGLMSVVVDLVPDVSASPPLKAPATNVCKM